LTPYEINDLCAEIEKRNLLDKYLRQSVDDVKAVIAKNKAEIAKMKSSKFAQI